MTLTAVTLTAVTLTVDIQAAHGGTCYIITQPPWEESSEDVSSYVCSWV